MCVVAFFLSTNPAVDFITFFPALGRQASDLMNDLKRGNSDDIGSGFEIDFCPFFNYGASLPQ